MRVTTRRHRPCIAPAQRMMPPQHSYVLGGTMHARTALTAALLALAGLTAGCGSGDSGNDKPSAPTATVTKTADQTASRTECVDAWADVIRQNEDAGIDDEPAACDGLPEDERLDRYMDGLQQVSKANRDEIAECVDDPTCTSVPIP